MKEATVPVKVSGIVVGTALIKEDGSLQMEMGPNKFTSELFLMLEVGLSNSIRITADTKPAVQRARVNLNGASNVQIGHGNSQINHY